MDQTEKKENIDINSETFKAGYRQGYLEGFEAACDKILAKLHAANENIKKDTDNGK